MNNPIIIIGNKIHKTSKNVKYKRKCNNCKKLYFGWGKFWCSKKCRQQPKGEESPFWKGNNITQQTGRWRAIKMFPHKPCEVCGSKNSERHHIDKNAINNNSNNIKYVCRKHHILIENRFLKMLKAQHPSSSQ